MLNDIYEELNKLIEEGNKDKVKKKIKSLKNINMMDKDNQTLLDYAVFRGNTKMAKALLKNGAYMDINDAKLIEYAAIAKDEKLLKILIKYGANINCMRDGKTPLMDAVDRGNVNMFKRLIENGADMEITRYLTIKPLIIYAVTNGNDEIFNEVVNLTRYIDQVDENMETALMCAVRCGNIDRVNILIEKGAYLYNENLEGETPLIIAVKNLDDKMAEFLISKGARMEEENRYGKTAAMFVDENQKEADKLSVISKDTVVIDPDGELERGSISSSSEYSDSISSLSTNEEMDSASISSKKTTSTLVVDEEGLIIEKNILKEKNPLKYQAESKKPLNKTNAKNKGITV